MSYESEPTCLPVCPRCGSGNWGTFFGRPKGQMKCIECGKTYYQRENDMACVICGRNCVCPSNIGPHKGQYVRITQKYLNGFTEIFEGPVHRVLWSEDPNILRTIVLGADSFRRTFNVTTLHDHMIEPATWETIQPEEPADKAIWVCPDVEGTGKAAIWRRLDHRARADARWFYPGSEQGQTWPNVAVQGHGYVLDPKNA